MRRNLSKLALNKRIGIEDMTYIEVKGFKRVHAISDEDLQRETDVKTSAVHFCRFEFNQAAKKAIKYGVAVKLGCDHPNYNMSTCDTVKSVGIVERSSCRVCKWASCTPR